VERADLRRKNWRGAMKEPLKVFFDDPAFLQQIAVVLHKLQSSKSMQHYSSSASEPTTKLLPPDAPKTAGQNINPKFIELSIDRERRGGY
jgi:hypothetical protein